MKVWKIPFVHLCSEALVECKAKITKANEEAERERET